MGGAVARLQPRTCHTAKLVDKPSAGYYYSTIMATERIQRRVERLLDQIEQEADQQNWQLVLDLAKEALGFALDNLDAAGTHSGHLLWPQCEEDLAPIHNWSGILLEVGESEERPATLESAAKGQRATSCLR